MNIGYGNISNMLYIKNNYQNFNKIAGDITKNNDSLSLSNCIIDGNINVYNGNIKLTNCIIRPNNNSDNDNASLSCYKGRVTLKNVCITGDLFLANCAARITSDSAYQCAAGIGALVSRVRNIGVRQSKLSLRGVQASHVRGIASLIKILEHSQIEHDVEVSHAYRFLITDSLIRGTLHARGDRLFLGDHAKVNHVRLEPSLVYQKPQSFLSAGYPGQTLAPGCSYSSVVINGGKTTRNNNGTHTGGSGASLTLPSKPQSIIMQNGAILKKLSFNSSPFTLILRGNACFEGDAFDARLAIWREPLFNPADASWRQNPPRFSCCQTCGGHRLAFVPYNQVVQKSLRPADFSESSCAKESSSG